MKNAACPKRLILLIVFVCTMTLTCSCKRETSGTEMTGETVILVTTEQTTPTPTKKPTPTPAPTPASVYIPREELPDGQLFEEGYYAVLPGEGAYYNVFDCYGQQIGFFKFTDGESIPPIGIYTEKMLGNYWRLNRSEFQDTAPTVDYYQCMKSTPNGFYQMDRSDSKNIVILYNSDGERIQTLTTPIADESEMWDIVVKCLGEETVVSFSVTDWGSEDESLRCSTTIYFVASDGKINDKCETKTMPNKPRGLIGREYFLVYGEEINESPFELIDFSGNVVMKGIDYLPESTFVLWTDEAVTYIYISDYFTVDGKIYDVSLQPVENNQVGTHGELIYGVEYDVEGIPCTAMDWMKPPVFIADTSISYDWHEGLVAVGMLNGQIAIKTQDAEYVFDSNGYSYYAMNQHALVLTNNNGAFQAVSLETGKLLPIPSGLTQVETADEYLIAGSSYDPNTGLSTGGFIIDKDGNIRYAEGDTSCECTLGEYIILYRGPYVGIADLNGDWIIKTLSSRYTRSL